MGKLPVGSFPFRFSLLFCNAPYVMYNLLLNAFAISYSPVGRAARQLPRGLHDAPFCPSTFSKDIDRSCSSQAGIAYSAALCRSTELISPWIFRSCLVFIADHFLPAGLSRPTLSQASFTSFRVRRPYLRCTLIEPGACLAYFIDIAVVMPSPISSVIRVARPECGLSLAMSAVHGLLSFFKDSMNLGASRRMCL